MAKTRTSIKDPDLAKVGVALKRAALKARQLGLASNTPVYVYRDGKIVDIVPELRAARPPKKVSANGTRTKKTMAWTKTLTQKRRKKPIK